VPGTSHRVLHLLAPAPFGGLEKVVLTLAAAQAERGTAVVAVPVVTSDPATHPVVGALRDAGIATEPLHMPARAYRAEVRAVRRRLDEHDIDILHTHGYRPDILALPIGWRRPVARVSTTHGFTGGGARNRFYEWLQRGALRRFDAVVAVSERMRRQLIDSGVPAARTHAIPNAWLPPSDLPGRREARRALGLADLPDDATVLGWVGRMSHEKAPDVMVEAFARAAAPRLHLSMIGSGPMEAALRRRAAEAGLGDRVRWHGVVEGAGRYMRAFDALFITSWTEGTPMTLLEAIGADVPVVPTAVGGIPDVVSGREAVLVEAGDLDALAAAARSLHEGKDEGRTRAERARARVERELAVEPWLARYDRVYDSATRHALSS